MRKRIAILNCDTDKGEFVDCNLGNVTHGVIYETEIGKKRVSVTTYNAYEGMLPEEDFDAVIITGGDLKITSDNPDRPEWLRTRKSRCALVCLYGTSMHVRKSRFLPALHMLNNREGCRC